jgi:hypothetical protein
VQAEHYDRDFQMDTAFYFRTGFTAGWGYSQVNFYPRSGQNFWIQRISPFVFAKAGHDRIQDGDENFFNTGLRFNFTRQGNFNIEVLARQRRRGKARNTGSATTSSCLPTCSGAVAQPVRRRRSSGPGIYYDDVDPFQGRSLFSFFGFELQPNQHLTQSVEGNVSRLDRESTGERIYDVMVLNSKTTYQFDKHFLVRFIANYDSSAHRVLTDFLARMSSCPARWSMPAMDRSTSAVRRARSRTMRTARFVSKKTIERRTGDCFSRHHICGGSRRWRTAAGRTTSIG